MNKKTSVSLLLQYKSPVTAYPTSIWSNRFKSFLSVVMGVR